MRFPALVLCSLCLTAITLACQEQPVAEPTDEPRPVLAPTATRLPSSYGGVMTVRLRSGISTVNPLVDSAGMAKISALLFSGLMKLDPQMRPVPDLAESWTASPDELVWTFKLRPNVRWHDGITFTSDDVLFTYGVFMDSTNSSPQTATPDVIAVAQADLLQVVEQIEAPDPYTVRLKLRRRFAPLLADLAVPILPRHLVREWSSAKLRQDAITIGTGPFRFVEQRGGDTVVLDSFQQYFSGRPYLDRVAFVSTDDDSAVLKGLREGTVLLAEITPETAAVLSNEGSAQLVSYPESTFYHVGFNLRAGQLFADKSLREAWAMATDLGELLGRTLGSSAQPINSDIPVYSWAYDPTTAIVKRDLGKARALLDAAGWREAADGVRVRSGRRLSIELAVRQDVPARIRFAGALAGQLREAGIEARVTPSDFDSTMAAARRPPFDFEALLMGWTIGADPDNYYLFHSSQIPTAEHPSGYNYVGFRNEGFDRLTIEARTTIDWQRRAEAYRQAQRIIAGELPYQFLWADRAYFAIGKNLRGVPETISPSFWSTIHQWRLLRD